MIYLIRDYKSKYKTEDLKGRALTDFCIKKCLETWNPQYDISKLNVIRDENGKPYVKGNSIDGIHISVSHSEDVFACAIATVNVGLDLQFAKKTKYQNLSKRYYSVKEQLAVEADGEDAFFRIWARKEAFAKFRGTGLIDVINGTCTFSLEDIEFYDLKFGEDGYVSLCFDGKGLKVLQNPQIRIIGE